MSPVSVYVEAGGTMTEAIESIRAAGGWQAVMRGLGQSDAALFREVIQAVFQVEDTMPSAFEFWMVGFLAGLATQAVTIPIDSDN